MSRPAGAADALWERAEDRKMARRLHRNGLFEFDPPHCPHCAKPDTWRRLRVLYGSRR